MSGVLNSGVDNIDVGGEGKPTVSLQCPTMPGDAQCDVSMYAGWDETIWSFGSATEYPHVSGDSDNDGYRNDVDVDDNNNGLIEISDLIELDLVRNDLAGTSLDGDSTGCPAQGCNGYELIADLNFDSNGNGVADAGDIFWNDSKGWRAIGSGGTRVYPFTGIFDGNNHSISNLNIHNQSDYVGLFSKTNNAVIRNIVLINPSILLNDGSSKDNAGVVAGHMDDSSLSNILVENLYVAGYGFSGGVVGSYYSDLAIENVRASGNVEGRSYVGGLFGFVTGRTGPESLEISNIGFEGNVSALDGAAGLFEGVMNAKVTDCYFKGVASTSGFDTAGLAVQIIGGSVSNCHIEAVVEVVADESPFSPTSYFTGGFFAEMGSSTLQRSSFIGTVSSLDRYSGGIAGAVSGTVSVNDVSIIADISADDCCTGGLFGAIVSKTDDLLESLEIDRVIVAGDISSGAAAWQAGVFGAYWVDRSEIESRVNVGEVYWDAEVSGVVNSGVDGIDVGGEGKTTFELQCPTMPGDVTCDADLYAGWDEAIWDFGTSSDYPVLR